MSDHLRQLFHVHVEAEQVTAACNEKVTPIFDRLDLPSDIEDTVRRALVDAFAEGIRFALVEAAAQMIEGGVNIDLAIIEQPDDSGAI